MRTSSPQAKSKPAEPAAPPARQGKSFVAQTKSYADNRPASKAKQLRQQISPQNDTAAQVTVNGDAPLQFQLPSTREFLHVTFGEQAQRGVLAQVANHLAAVEEEKEKRSPRTQVLFTLIDRLDKSINVWFDTFRAPDMTQVPNAAFMKHLHEEVETEHRRLIGFAIEHPQNFIPVNVEHLTPPQIRQVYLLWNSIIKGTGNISVVGTKEFQTKTYANLARLMQGAYGRSMVAYLNSGTVSVANRTTIGTNFDTTFAKHNTQETEQGSYAFPRTSLGNNNDVASDIQQETVLNPAYPVAATLRDINRLMVAGRPGVTYKGISYTFRQGGGSLVKIVEDGDEHPQVDRDLNQVLTPSYITLGHELGHALRNRGGGSFRGAKTDTHTKLLDTEEGDHGPNSSSLWTNSEEIVNITTSENQLRDEHLLTNRKYHATQQVAFSEIFQRELENVVFAGFPAERDARGYITGSDYWQNQIVPAIQDHNWTKQKLITRKQYIQHVRANIVPVAREKFQQHSALFDIQRQHSSVISLDNFKKIKEVKEVLLNLRSNAWNKPACALKIATVRKFISDKAWWRNFKITGAVLTTFAAIGIGTYLKYFSGGNNPGGGNDPGGNVS